MSTTVDYESFRAFGEAAAIGLLIGVERYKNRAADEKQPAGVRTFTIISLLGAACALLGQPMFTSITFAGLLLLFCIGYFREANDSLGLTTEFAALLTFWLGYLVRGHETLAISTGIVVVILLASKKALHGFVRGRISALEFYDTLKFLAVVFVVFPLLPDRSIGPYELFNPTQIWTLVIVVSSISYLGYILIRALGSERGLMLGSILGGLVSTTAVTMSLAQRARTSPELSRICGVTAVMANAVQFPRLLALIAVVDQELARLMAVPLLSMCAVGMGGAWILGRVQGVWKQHQPAEVALANPYSFWPALKFALLFVGVFALAQLGKIWLGDQGIYLVSAISGLADASAISLSVADMVHRDTLPAAAAATAVLIAVSANAILKEGLAIWAGTRSLAFWLGGGLLTMLVTGGLVLAMTSASAS